MNTTALKLVRTARNWKTLKQIKATLKLSSAKSGSVEHPLSENIIISLTSIPPRFRNLHLVIKSLMAQTISVNVVLYVDEGHDRLLPRTIWDLEGDKLRIATTKPIRSYAKLIPALKQYPNHHIITVDDDVIYPADLVEVLLSGMNRTDIIVCRRAHRVSIATDGNLLPYNSWPQDVQDSYARRPSHDLLPTGVGGILYPPNVLHPSVADMDLAMRLCPRADDVWFYWMARKAGTLQKKVGGETALLHTPTSQSFGLWQTNALGGNDTALINLLREFGMPAGFPEPYGKSLTFSDAL